MYDEYMTKNNNFKETSIENIFDNLTQDIANVNKFISEVNMRKKINDEGYLKLEKERENLNKLKQDFENYTMKYEQELDRKKKETDQYIALQQEKLKKAEEEFKNNMSNSLSELENKNIVLEEQKKELEQKKQEFNIYKEATEKKLSEDNKNLEEKCLKFREIINQVSDNFQQNFNEE